MRLIATALALFGAVALAACATTSPEAPTHVRSDADIRVPGDSSWQRLPTDTWLLDLGVKEAPDIQLGIQDPDGRGVVRVALPEEATGARLDELLVLYARAAPSAGEDPEAASGDVVWHLHADAGGRPGAVLGAVRGTVDGRNAAHLGRRNWPAKYELGVEVPSVFWLVFERTSGHPRVAGTRTFDYGDLYYLSRADADLDRPVNARPHISLLFSNLGR